MWRSLFGRSGMNDEHGTTTGETDQQLQDQLEDEAELKNETTIVTEQNNDNNNNESHNILLPPSIDSPIHDTNDESISELNTNTEGFDELVELEEHNEGQVDNNNSNNDESGSTSHFKTSITDGEDELQEPTSVETSEVDVQLLQTGLGDDNINTIEASVNEQSKIMEESERSTIVPNRLEPATENDEVMDKPNHLNAEKADVTADETLVNKVATTATPEITPDNNEESMDSKPLANEDNGTTSISENNNGEVRQQDDNETNDDPKTIVDSDNTDTEKLTNETKEVELPADNNDTTTLDSKPAANNETGKTTTSSAGSQGDTEGIDGSSSVVVLQTVQQNETQKIAKDTTPTGVSAKQQTGVAAATNAAPNHRGRPLNPPQQFYPYSTVPVGHNAWYPSGPNNQYGFMYPQMMGPAMHPMVLHSQHQMIMMKSLQVPQFGTPPRSGMVVPFVAPYGMIHPNVSTVPNMTGNAASKKNHVSPPKAGEAIAHSKSGQQQANASTASTTNDSKKVTAASVNTASKNNDVRPPKAGEASAQSKLAAKDAKEATTTTGNAASKISNVAPPKAGEASAQSKFTKNPTVAYNNKMHQYPQLNYYQVPGMTVPQYAMPVPFMLYPNGYSAGLTSTSVATQASRLALAAATVATTAAVPLQPLLLPKKPSKKDQIINDVSTAEESSKKRKATEMNKSPYERPKLTARKSIPVLEAKPKKEVKISAEKQAKIDAEFKRFRERILALEYKNQCLKEELVTAESIYARFTAKNCNEDGTRKKPITNSTQKEVMERFKHDFHYKTHKIGTHTRLDTIGEEFCKKMFHNEEVFGPKYTAAIRECWIDVVRKDVYRAKIYTPQRIVEAMAKKKKGKLNFYDIEALRQCEPSGETMLPSRGSLQRAKEKFIKAGGKWKVWPKKGDPEYQARAAARKASMQGGSNNAADGSSSDDPDTMDEADDLEDLFK